MKRFWKSLGVVVVAAAASVALVAPGSAQAAADTTPPTAPSGLTVTGLSFTWATLAWSPSTDNSGSLYYEVTIDLPSGPYSPNPSEDTTVQFGGLEAGHTYTVSVRALDYAGNASAPVSTHFTTLARTVPPPTAPANLRGVLTGGVLTGIAWDPSVFSGHVSYVLWSGSTQFWSTSKTSVTVRELVFDAEAVHPGGAYTLKVQAIGTDNYLSDFSAPLTVTIPKTVPVR
ncbi:fibronectin type III domain-containing protein [Actinoplanes sp. CA-142083]|uniref:fibronectin type III domain-containing protein n=1 Tax=Actinoplanes sp. CA-142083 TaxID=3239903 RepID=UPI003D90C3BD